MSRHGSLNRVYRVVFNQTKGVWQAVAEIGKTAGKSSSASRKKSGLVKALSALARKLAPRALIGSLFLVSTSALAASLPQNGQVVGGQAQIDSNGSDMTVTQSTHKAAINWDSFDIGQQNSVTFNQPGASSVALNRVTGSDPSKIQGVLNANGQVFLINPNGITFTQDAQVNVGGIVASTLDIDTDDFLNGDYTFQGDSSSAIVNQGNIQSQDGYVAMIAASIENSGQVEANNGSVLMGAGQKVTLDMGGPVKIQIEEKALNAHIRNGGAIKADGGLVYLTAQAAGDLASTVINNDGIIEAQTLETGQSGEIYLMGDMDNDQIQIGGTLDASAPNGGDGGFIETSAARVDIQPGVQVTTLADNGQTGEWLIDPTDIEIVAGEGGNFSGDSVTSSSIGAKTLTDNLANNNITVQTPGTATEGQLGDITVNAPIEWNAGTTLTLDAHNDIYVNALIRKTVVNGNIYGGGVKFKAKNNQDAVVFGEGGLVVAVNSDQLQWINTALNGNYAIYRPIDLEGVNWTPIANFNGTFDGSTQSIENLTIETVTAGGNAALFESIGTNGVVKGLRFKNANILAGDTNGLSSVKNVAILAAENAGTVENVMVSSPSTVGNSALDVERIGGLVALNNQGDISSSSASSINIIANEVFAAGALVGQQRGGTITGGTSQLSNVTVETAVASPTAGAVGGLVGHADSGAEISDSWVWGNTVTVTNGSNTGGMVGHMDGSTLKKSYAAGQGVVDGFNYVGGLVGTSAFSTIEQTYSTYEVKGNYWVGGLVGLAKNSQGQAATILNSYATGSVRASSFFGGLVGKTDNDKIIMSYSIGEVIGLGEGSAGGGLVGSVSNSDSNIELVENSLWDIDASGISSGIGVGKGFAHPTTGDIGMDKFKTYNNYGWDIVEGNTDTDPALGSWYKYPILSFTTQSPGDSVWKIYGEAAPVSTPDPTPEATPELAPEPRETATREAQRTAAQLPQSTQALPSQIPTFNAPDASSGRVGGLQVVNLSGDDQGDSAGNGEDSNSDSMSLAQALADTGQSGIQPVFVVDGGIRLPDDGLLGE